MMIYADEHHTHMCDVCHFNNMPNLENINLSVHLDQNELDQQENIETLKYLEDALKVVIELIDFNEEFGFNEMLPSWKRELDLALSYMQKALPYISDPRKLEQTKSSISHGRNLMTYMPVLQLHKFVIK